VTPTAQVGRRHSPEDPHGRRHADHVQPSIKK
jgi:hypothetical protein